MSILKSNSALIAFDNSSLSNVNEFSFLNYVQSFSLNNSSNRLNQKYLGSSTLNKTQFVQPEVDLNIRYIQKNDFFNEKLFGFNVILGIQEYTSIAKNLAFNNFFNKNAFILFNDELYNDVAYQLFDGNFNSNMLSIAIGNLFLNSYSFSYSIGTMAFVDVSFSSSDLKISKLAYQNGYVLQNWDDSLVPLTKDISIPFIQDTRDYISKNIVYHMNNFSFSNDFQSTSTPGPTIDSFLNGLIQSLNFSIDFSRNKFYFFNRTNSPSERKIILPIRANFEITGISKDFEVGNLKNLFNADQKFSSVISVGDSTNSDFDFYQILLDDITVESFDYSLDLQNTLNYSIKCSIDIDTQKGFRILQRNTKKVIFLQDKNFGFILSKEGYYLGVKI
jgi:hypothetical protein